MNMNFSAEALVSGLCVLLVTGIGWWVKTIWQMVIEQQRLIASLQVELARNYVPRVELEANFVRIFKVLDEIRTAIAVRNLN